MAKSKRRRYYKKSFKRYKNVSMNYLRVKVEYIDRITFQVYEPFTNEGYANGGPAIFFSRSGQQIMDDRRVVSLGSVQAGYSYTESLKSLFSYYRPTGIRIEVTPESRSLNLSNTYLHQNVNHVVPTVPVILSYRMGNNTAQSFTEAKANNQSIVLNSNAKVARYWRIYGATTAYATTQNSFTGAFTVANEYPIGLDQDSNYARGMMVYALQPSWTVKINVYYLYKYSKA